MLVKCDNCGKSYKIDAKAIGKKVQCKCGHKFVAAQSPEASAPPPLPTEPGPPAIANQTDVSTPPQVKSVRQKPEASVIPTTEPPTMGSVDSRMDETPAAGGTIVVSSEPSPRPSSRSRSSSNKWMILGIGGGVAIVLGIVLVVMMNSKDNGGSKTADKTSNGVENKKASSNADDNILKSNKKSNTQNKKKDKTPGSNQKSTASNPVDKKGEKKSKSKGSGSSAKDPHAGMAFQPDITSQVELPDWEIDADPDLAKVVKTFLMSTGKEREALEEALIRAGATAAPFIAKEIRAVENDRKRPYSVFPLSKVLSKIGPQAIPELLALVNDESLEDKTRAEAIRAVSEMGPVAQKTIPDLIKIYRTQKAARLGGLKMSVIGALGNIETGTDDGISILKEVLENKTGEYSLPYITVAIKAAKGLGPDASALVPALRPYLLEQSNHSRDAAEALGAIGSGAGSAAPEFIELIERDDKVVTYRRYHALRDIGPTASSTIPALIKALKDSTHDPDRADIADALGRMGAAAADAIPTLTAYLEEAEKEEPGQAQRVVFKLAIARIEGNQASAVPYLRQTLYDNTHNARSEAIIQIGTLGKDALPLVPDLAKLILELKPKASAVRLAIHSLGHLGKHGADGLGALITFINRQHVDPNGQKTFRLHAIDSIAWINSDDRVLTGLERIAHHDPNINARDKARRLLMKIRNGGQ